MATKMVTVRFPMGKNDKDDIYVAVNGRSFLIKRGVEVTIPEYVLKILENQEKDIAESQENREKLKKGAKAQELN